MSNHASLIIISNWRRNQVEVSLCCSCARRSRVQVETSTSKDGCLILEIKLCRTYRYIICALAHIISVVRIIRLKMLQSHFLGLHTLGILLLYSIRVLGATKPSLCILCTILLRWICRCICWPFRDNQGRFRSTLIHDSIKRSDVALAQDNLLWQLKVIVRDILDIVNLSRLLQTLLIWWCTSSKRPFQIKLSCILIFG